MAQWCCIRLGYDAGGALYLDYLCALREHTLVVNRRSGEKMKRRAAIWILQKRFINSLVDKASIQSHGTPVGSIFRGQYWTL